MTNMSNWNNRFWYTVWKVCTLRIEKCSQNVRFPMTLKMCGNIMIHESWYSRTPECAEILIPAYYILRTFFENSIWYMCRLLVPYSRDLQHSSGITNFPLWCLNILFQGSTQSISVVFSPFEKWRLSLAK